MLVVVAHLAGELDDHGYQGYWPNMTAGVFGVDLFFVISGFILVYANATRFGTAATGTFLLRRVIRVAPLYWLFTGIFALVVIRQARHTGLTSEAIRHIVSSFLFLPSAEPDTGDMFPTYQLGWTLNYEMFFYVCMAGVIPLRRRRAIVALTILFAGLVVSGAVWSLPMPLAWWARSQILEFVMGMLIAHAFVSGVRLRSWGGATVAALSAATVPLFVPYLDQWDVLRGLAWGLPAAGIMAGMALVQPYGRGRVQRALEALGNASYSLYLVHYAFFVAVAYVLGGVLDRHAISPATYSFTLLAGSLLSAFALHRLVERPMTRALHRLAGFGGSGA